MGSCTINRNTGAPTIYYRKDPEPAMPRVTLETGQERKKPS